MPVVMQAQFNGDRELRRYLDTIRRRAGRVGDACLVWAQAVAKDARSNARAKSKGGSFWHDQADRVRAAKRGTDGAAVMIDYIGKHKEEGGDIFPTRAKALTIPISEEAEGKRAGEFEMGGRELFTIDSDNPETTGILGYSENDQFHALYVLRTRVHQDPEPWFPTTSDIRATGRRELARFADSLTRGGL